MMPPNRLFIHYFETKELNIVLSNYKLFLSSYLIYVYIYIFCFSQPTTSAIQLSLTVSFFMPLS